MLTIPAVSSFFAGPLDARDRDSISVFRRVLDRTEFHLRVDPPYCGVAAGRHRSITVVSPTEARLELQHGAAARN